MHSRRTPDQALCRLQSVQGAIGDSTCQPCYRCADAPPPHRRDRHHPGRWHVRASACAAARRVLPARAGPAAARRVEDRAGRDARLPTARGSRPAAAQLPDQRGAAVDRETAAPLGGARRSEEHTSELQSRRDLVCRLLLEKKKKREKKKLTTKKDDTIVTYA